MGLVMDVCVPMYVINERGRISDLYSMEWVPLADPLSCM